METRYVTFGLTSTFCCEKLIAKTTAVTPLYVTHTHVEFKIQDSFKLVCSVVRDLFHYCLVKLKPKGKKKKKKKHTATLPVLWPPLHSRRKFQLNLPKLRVVNKGYGLKTRCLRLKTLMNSSETLPKNCLKKAEHQKSLVNLTVNCHL